MTEQELKDEREQAVKRGGEIYADHYMEGLLDGMNLALRQPPVSGRSELLLAFAEWYNNNEIIKPRSLILKDDVLVFLSQQ